MGERHPVLERITQWSIARTKILRAAASSRGKNNVTPEEARTALEDAYQVVLDLREMADSIEADIQQVLDIADEFLQDNAESS